MATFLFDKIIFGPVFSRRLGISLGINLLPNDSKLCNFNCIYCECGWTKDAGGIKLHSRQQVFEALEIKLSQMQESGQNPDVITFAGNGEPTMHPEFEGIIDDTITLRNKYFPNTRIAVLSNSTMINKPSVFNALNKVDQNILKLDSAFEQTIELLNCPTGRFIIQELVTNFKKFNGHFIIQTMFIKGIYNGKIVDNTTDTEINAWLKLISEIHPEQVMIYTYSRDTAAKNLLKIPIEQLEEIGKKIKLLGIDVQISG
jgi:wyosine [tRNA(Phe)-imidazoG37] synthetase (radical SAM superfamily)